MDFTKNHKIHIHWPKWATQKKFDTIGRKSNPVIPMVLFSDIQFYLSYRKLKSGDILSLNCFPMVQGYYIALERTMFVHHATDAHLKYWDVNLATHIKGSKLIKPGVK